MRSRLPLAIVAAAVGVGFAVRLVAARPVEALAVEGVVRDAAGRAVPGVTIRREGFKDRSGGSPVWTSDAEGRFRVEDVPAGEVLLRVSPGDGDMRTGQVVRTTAGARDVVVVVDPGPQVFLRIAGFAPPEGSSRYARLTWLEADGRRPTRYAPIRADGWTRFVRVAKDVDLELWTVAAPGKPVRRAGLRAGDEEIRIEPVVGREIRGKLLVGTGDKAQSASLTTTVYPGFTVGRVQVADDGSFVVSELPEGKYRLSAYFAFGAVSLPVVAPDVATGTTDVVLDLRR